MPRTSRVVLPGYPHHVIQRGHNRQPLFVEDSDYSFLLSTLADWKQRLGCKVYAFCLMTNHTHLIIDPGDHASNLAILMKQVAGRYTRYWNRRRERSGTVWNGRFKSSPIETDRYLMACSRYVELNPVRAGMVAGPADYRWSSYCDRIGKVRFPWLDENPIQFEMGRTRAERHIGYRAWTLDGVPRGEWEFIRSTIQRGQLTGDHRFGELVRQQTGRRVYFRGQGRPVGAKKKGSVPF